MTKNRKSEDDANTHDMPAINRSSKGLRDAMFDELDAIRNGRSNPNRLIAVSKIACQIINSVKMEIEYQKHVASSSQASNGDGFVQGSTLQLGGANG